MRKITFGDGRGVSDGNLFPNLNGLKLIDQSRRNWGTEFPRNLPGLSGLIIHSEQGLLVSSLHDGHGQDQD